MNEPLILNKIASSSNGNCYIYNNDLMVDIGVSFNKIKPYYKNIKLLLLTHLHSDHFNRKTIKKLLELRPTIKIICCPWLVQDLVDLGIKKSNIIILQIDYKYDFGKYIISPFHAKHDIPNCRL